MNNSIKSAKLTIIESKKKETKNEIETLDDIFKFSAELLKTIELYEK